MFKSKLFNIVKKEGTTTNYKANCYTPVPARIGMSHLRLVDAVYNGVGVSVKDGYKVFDQTAVNQLVENYDTLDGLTFEKCLFTNVTWGGEITGWYITECKFVDCDFSMLTAKDMIVDFSEFTNCKFTFANISSEKLNLLTINDCDFERATITGEIYGGRVSDSNFEEITLLNTGIFRNFFRRCNFTGALFNNANFKNCKFEKSESKGIVCVLPGVAKEKVTTYTSECKSLFLMGGEV